MRAHEVDYVSLCLVAFWVLGDDINKFLWMVRIAEGIWPDEVQERASSPPVESTRLMARRLRP